MRSFIGSSSTPSATNDTHFLFIIYTVTVFILKKAVTKNLQWMKGSQALKISRKKGYYFGLYSVKRDT